MRLKDWRKRNKLTMRGTAALFGIASPNHIMSIEAGETSVSFPLMFRIARVTESVVLPADLLHGWVKSHRGEARAIAKAARDAVNRAKSERQQREFERGEERKSKGAKTGRKVKGTKAGKGGRSGDQRHQKGSRSGEEPEPHGREKDHQELR